MTIETAGALQEVLEQTRRILTGTDGGKAPGSQACCSTAKQELCCEPSAKAACCGAAPAAEGGGAAPSADAGCGCQ